MKFIKNYLSNRQLKRYTKARKRKSQLHRLEVWDSLFLQWVFFSDINFHDEEQALEKFEKAAIIFDDTYKDKGINHWFNTPAIVEHYKSSSDTTSDSTASVDDFSIADSGTFSIGCNTGGCE